MSEMTSIVEQHQQQPQQYLGAGASSESDKLSCKDCGMNFDSSSSLEVHLRYHQENLMSQWTNQGNQQDENVHNNNNNTNKTGNHNSAGSGGSHVNAGTPKPQRDASNAPADPNESNSRPPSVGSGAAVRLQQQQQQHQEQQQQLHQQQQQQQQQQSFGQSFVTLFTDPSQYYIPQEDYNLMSSHYSSDTRQDGSSGGPMRQQSNYSRYQPYSIQPCGPGTVVNPSPSPRSSPLQCDKCGTIFEDTNQLSEHVRTNHPDSPAANSYSAPVATQQQQQQQQQAPQQPAAPQPTQQYQQLAGSPQQQVTQPQQSQAQTQQQMHASPPHVQQNQQQQMGHQSYDFTGGLIIKNDLKTEPEEQAEILDLDSHKVQTHRFDDEFMRMQQQQQEMHMMQHQVLQQHQSRGVQPHTVPPIMTWPSATQAHEYHNELSPMGPMTSVSPIQDQQNQFMRGQTPHITPQVETPRLQSSPIITSNQPMPSPLATGLITPNAKPPPLVGNQSWKSNEARRPKTYNCTACNKWFTSSGHLKRHYNTTLHKNAVKQSNQPDPANMPISAHHHPARDSNRGGASATRSSPEHSSSSSPPNLVAGPSGEATRGLLPTPTPTSTPALFNNNSNSSNSSEAIQVQASMGQNCLEHQQQQAQHQPPHLQQQQLSPSTATLVQQPLSSMAYPNSPGLSPMGQAQQLQSSPQQHLQQIGSPSHQQQLVQPLQHQQSHHHIAMGSSLHQIGASGHHTTTSPMSPMQQHHQLHMNSPSPMGSVVHHPMNSPSPTMLGQGPSTMASPPSGSMMGGTSMPHQPYPNALPPHVTTITSIPDLLESITNPQITIGNSDLEPVSLEHSEMLSSFGNFSAQDQHKPLPSFEQFSEIANGFIVGQNHTVLNVGGLGSPEENIPPQDYMMYRDQYDCITDMDLLTSNTDGDIMIDTQYTELQTPKHESVLREHQETVMPLQQQQQPQQQQQELLREPAEQQDLAVAIISKEGDQNFSPEKNNNEKGVISKEGKGAIPKEGKGAISKVGKGAKKKPKTPRVPKRKPPRVHVTSKPHFISENGVHKCIECNKTFNKACYLTQHNKSFHSGEKPFKCSLCGKRFAEEPQHAEHLRKHAGDKPHKCEVCPKEFNHKTDLRRHFCLHSGEKPFNCAKCGKGFIRKDHMMKHLDTHRRKELQQNAKNLRT